MFNLILMNVRTIILLKVSRLRSFSKLFKLAALLLWMAVLVIPVAAQKKTDLVVVLDTSIGMFDSFEESTELLIEDVLKKQLTAQDSFHLISFNGTPEFEIERELTDETMVKEALSRLMLLQPLGNHCDLIAAIKYATEYLDELTINSRKRILLLTQGSHVPPPDSPYTDEEDNIERIEDLASFIRRNGWEMNIVRFTGGGEEDTEETAQEKILLNRLAENLKIPLIRPEEDEDTFRQRATGAVEVSFPEETIKGGRELSLPLTFTNHSHEKKNIVIDSITADGSELIEEPYSLFLDAEEEARENIPLTLPDSYTEGSHELLLTLNAQRGGPMDPESGEVTIELEDRGASTFLGGRGMYFIYVIIFLILLVPIFILVRRVFPSDDEDDYRKKTGAGTTISELAGAETGIGGKAGSSRRSTERTGQTEKEKGKTKRASTTRDYSRKADAAARGKKSKREDYFESKDTSFKKESSIDRKEPERGREREDITLKKAERSGERDLELKKEPDERDNIFSESKAQQKTSTTLVDTAKDESKDRASALSSFKKSSAKEESKERAEELSTFKKRAAAAGDKRRGSAPGFSGIVYRKRKEAGEKPLELRIDFQHPTPDKNLSWFRNGDERTLGGPGSGADFIVSTIPVEGIIASIRRTGDSFEFKPLEESYFPDYHVKETENVLGKRIKLRSPETERVTNFSLREWVPTTERLNRYLHIIDQAGKPEGEEDPGEL
ncbi:MAG: VWA domain-containing protein [Spirochaetia bacterium]